MKLKLFIFILAFTLCNSFLFSQTFTKKSYRDSLENAEIFRLKNELSILQLGAIIASSEDDSDELNIVSNKIIITTELLSEKGFENGDLYYWMGRAFYTLDDLTKAIPSFTKGLEFNDRKDVNYEYRGYAKLLLNDFRGAKSDFDKSLEISETKGASLYYNRGVCFMQLNQFELAISDYSTAITKVPKNGSYYFQRGLVYLRLEKKEKGCADLSNAGNYGFSQAYEVIKKYCN